MFCCSAVPAFAFEYDVSAQCAVLMDAATGTVLFEKNAQTQHPMASTTKIMTCLLACESQRLQETVTVTQEMLDGLEGTSLALEAGNQITLYDLVQGAILESGNDAANAIAVFLSGSTQQFVTEMNARAAAIGMKHTLFVTPSGLDEGDHHSTAYDMALLAAEALKNDIFASVCQSANAQITVNGVSRSVTNHNKLLAVSEHFTGVKTGFTKKAGRCLVSSYDYYGSTLICVTLNAPNDWDDHINLVNQAKSEYRIYSDTDTLSVPCVGDDSFSVACSYRYSIAALGEVQCKLYYYPFVYAPYQSGDSVGYAEITCNGKTIAKETITII